MWQALPLDALAQLQQLRLKWAWNPGELSEGGAMQIGWSHLQRCSQLRVLELSHASHCFTRRGHLTVAAVELQSVLDPCAASLEELRLDSSIRIDYEAVRPTTVARRPPLPTALPRRPPPWQPQHSRLQCQTDGVCWHAARSCAC